MDIFSYNRNNKKHIERFFVERKTKLAIVGKGTAGSLAAAHFYRYLPEGAELEWYFDPNKLTQSVGEGSTLSLPRNLFDTIGFTHGELKKIKGTFKTGIHKENWGIKNKSFFHDFPPPNSGYHFNAVELQNYIIDRVSDKVNIIPKAVDLENIDADIVLNASGVPKSFEDFNISEYIPVNAAYITQCYWDYPEFDYTLTIAMKHGWVFGIPLQNRCSIGYLYNSSINTEEQIIEDVQQIFKKYKLTPSKDTNSLNFKNYYRKENCTKDGKIFHTGNASFFLEPLEATSISVMNHIQRAAFDTWSGAITVEEANNNYLSLIHKIELIIAIHYAAGSPFNTDFWSYAQDLGMKKIIDSKKDIDLRKMYHSIVNVDRPELVDGSVEDYGVWWQGSFVQNIAGLGIEKIMKDNFD